MKKFKKYFFDSLSLTKISKLKYSAVFLIAFGLMSSSITVKADTNSSVKGVSEAKQSANKQGTIKDESGEAIIGATIRVKSSSKATISDIDGNFSIEAQKGDILEITYMGYENQIVHITEKNNYEIVMREKSFEIDEVVVVGYGTQKKANLTGSVASISADRITDRPIAQATAALQGLTSGVTVTTTSGAPGSDVGAIRIRGVSSFEAAAAAPLVLIDGVQGSLNDVDPNLIESISVLKDAASAAIYGSRAASGVVLVTTKRSSEERFSVNYSAYTGWQKPTNLPKKVNAIDHMNMINLAAQNSGSSLLFPEDKIEQWKEGQYTDPDNYPNTDWQDQVLTGSGFMQSHFISMNAGSQKIKVNTSIGYLDQDGIIETANYNRFTFNNNLDFQVDKKLNVRLNLRYVNTKTTEPGVSNSTVFYMVNRLPATQPGILSNGLYGEGWNGNNPIAMTRDGGSREKRIMTLQGTLQINYKPVEWLTADVSYTPKLLTLDNNNYNKAVVSYYPTGSVAFTRPAQTELTKSHERRIANTLVGTLTADKTFNKIHNIKFLAGASYEDYASDIFQGSRVGSYFPDYPYLGAMVKNSDTDATGGAAEWVLLSFFGRINYDYKSRYLFEANARYDGSSRFAKGNKWGFYPSFSAAWRMSEEPFFEGIKDVVDNLKFRASWGELGSQTAAGNYDFASLMALGTGAMGGENIPLAALNNMANPYLVWESSRMWNVGLDVTLFNKLNITAEMYNKLTDDLLMTVDIPLTVGLNAPMMNAGKVRNRGWEVMIDYRDNIGKFNYNVGFNISDVRNKILAFAGTQSNSVMKNIKGYSIQSLFGYEAIGYYQTEEDIEKYATTSGSTKTVGLGDIIYRDRNNDGIINQEDEIKIGETIPRYTYGINLGMEYQGIGLDMFFQGVGKADGYLSDSAIQPFYGGGTAQEQHKDYWTPENRNAKFPRLTYGDGGSNFVRSSFWRKDASYLRLKNIQVSYTLPKAITRKFNVDRLRFYVAGQNLFTLDNFWDGYDVETPAGNGRTYPQVKTYTIGFDIKF